jgi:uncharacterized membrane protein YesL
MREAVPLRETGRRAAECALLGVIWTVCSLPVVTAGAAWSAVAEICHAWNRGEEPPLVRTFASVIRRDFLGGLGMTVLGLASAAPLLEARVSLAAGFPVARAEAGALVLVGAAAISVVALAFPHRAAVRSRWRESLRAAVALAAARPWVVPLVAVALGLPAFLVIACPALIVFIGGPAGYAVSAVHARAVTTRPEGPRPRAGRNRAPITMATIAAPAPGHTMWMPPPCTPGDMSEASTSYEGAPAASGVQGGQGLG